LINFDEEFIPPPKFIFEISPGNKEITKGDGLEISVKVKGSQPYQFILLYVKRKKQISKARVNP